jgi:hypothetical protein
MNSAKFSLDVRIRHSPKSRERLGSYCVARLNIPERYRAAISSIRSLSDSDVRRIRALLDGANTGFGAEQETGESPLNPNEVIKTIKASGASVPIANIENLLEAILSLYLVKSDREVTLDAFVKDVCDAMERLEGNLRLLPDERQDFSAKLLTLLNADVLSLAVKAHDLATEDERVFCRARILTDLRPVFGADISDGAQAMVIVHTLKMVVHEEGNAREHRELYVTLDSDDLRSLRQVIDRAEAKGRALSSAVVKNIPVIGISK